MQIETQILSMAECSRIGVPVGTCRIFQKMEKVFPLRTEKAVTITMSFCPLPPAGAKVITPTAYEKIPFVQRQWGGKAQYYIPKGRKYLPQNIDVTESNIPERAAITSVIIEQPGKTTAVAVKKAQSILDRMKTEPAFI